MNNTIEFYSNNALKFKSQYLSQDAENVHGSWRQYLPTSGQILDVGAGVGRDAKWLVNLGFDVVAVEPASQFMEIGKELTQGQSVHWMADILPELSSVYQLQTRFDLILLSAVWMHIPSRQRERAFRKLSNLLKPGGKLVISLRHGSSPDERCMYPVDVDEVTRFAQQFGLSVKKIIQDNDKLKRQDVFWETVVLEMPDDGGGAFPIIRNILMNDAKSSTYKLALIRVLLRIADGHPGAVLRREDDRVILPLGLVSLYWARQYKPLIDQQVQQSSNANRGLGFIKENGWLKLSSRAASDFSIGHLFVNEEAQALDQMLKDISKTIKEMPAKFITLPNSEQQVFEVEIFRCKGKKEALFTDFDTLSQYGEFSIPIKVWDLISLYGCWIEPVAINEWVNVMSGYKMNKGKFDKQVLFSILDLAKVERNTTDARNKVEEIKQSGEQVYCLWGKNKLPKKYDIDHCLPFSRWPNNDLWNLFPSAQKLNLEKSDKLASNHRLQDSKELIQQWWSHAWVLNKEYEERRFFAEANISLPGLGRHNKNTDDIFEALKLQHVRIREMQQLKVW